MKNKMVLLTLTMLLVGCTGITGNAVKSGDSVSIEYTGSLDDGTVFDTNVDGEPLKFTVGAGQMISGFDQAIIGMTVDEEKTFTLSPEEAYGNRRDELIIEYNKTELSEMIGQELKEGMILYSKNGPITVLSVGEVNATLDLNHPLAGKSLTFTVKILSIE